MRGAKMEALAQTLQKEFGTDVVKAHEANPWAAIWVFQWMLLPDAPGMESVTGDADFAGREVFQRLYEKYCSSE
jgi:hypothetical protein